LVHIDITSSSSSSSSKKKERRKRETIDKKKSSRKALKVPVTINKKSICNFTSQMATSRSTAPPTSTTTNTTQPSSRNKDDLPTLKTRVVEV